MKENIVLSLIGLVSFLAGIGSDEVYHQTTDQPPRNATNGDQAMRAENMFFADQEARWVAEGKGRAFVVYCVHPKYKDDPTALAQLPGGFCQTGAGASLAIVNSEAYRRYLVEEMALLQGEGADVRRLYVVDHFCPTGQERCKAYATDDSRARHEANMQQAAEIVQQMFPGLEVILLLQDIHAGTLDQIEVGAATTALQGPPEAEFIGDRLIEADQAAQPVTAD